MSTDRSSQVSWADRTRIYRLDRSSRIASTNPYFTSNCVYSSNERLSNIRSVDVFVLTAGLAKTYSLTDEKSQGPIYDQDSGSESLDADNRKKIKLSPGETPSNKSIHSMNAALIEQLLETRSFFIDIDLSFFSTDDSIRKQFDENEYEILRYVYTRIVQESTDAEIQRYIAARETVLEQMRASMEEYLTEPKEDQAIVTE